MTQLLEEPRLEEPMPKEPCSRDSVWKDSVWKSGLEERLELYSKGLAKRLDAQTCNSLAPLQRR